MRLDRPRHLSRLAAAAAIAVAAAGCAGRGVEWATTRAAPPGPGELRVDAAGRVAIAAPHAPPATLPAATMCPGSVRFAWLDATHVYAAWWSPRPDSSAAVQADYSADGGVTWRGVAMVDTLDRSGDGCRRAAPGIAASGDYVHVVYGLRAPEGAGVFFSHSMDRGALFHAPVIITYADQPGAAAVAAHGDTVVVAYQDPNQTPSQIGLAVSRTMGHTFEERTAVTSGALAATDPEVALVGTAVAVGWRERPAGDSAAVRMVRVGRLR